MISRTAALRQAPPPTGYARGFASLGLSVQVRQPGSGGHLSRVAACVFGMMLASQLEWGELQNFVLDVVLGFAAWDSLLMRADIDELMLIGATRTDVIFHAVTPGVGNEVATMFATIVAIALVVGKATVLPLIEKIARRRAYMRRLDCRDKTFHYSCDQFWLRVQGR
jgi:hypothetical protein